MQHIISRGTASHDAVLQNSYSKTAVLTAKLYIFLLPIRMIAPLTFLNQYLGVCATYLDFFLHLLGLLLIMGRSKGVLHIGRDQSSRLFHFFALMVAWFNLSSVVMAFFIQTNYGNIGSESAFMGISGMFVYFIQYAFIIFYNKEVFKMLSKEEIIRILNKVMIFLLILGYIQILVMIFHGIFSTVYDSLNFLGTFYKSNMPKLCLTGTEGASAGTVIGTLVYPFLLSRLIVQPKKWPHILQLLAWLPIVYFTYSTVAYVLVAVDMLVFSFIYLFAVRKSVKSVFISLAILGVMLVLLVSPSTAMFFLPKETQEDIQYLLLEKATDQKNGSTVSRTVPLYVNWGAFTEYPVLGVGNGNQGYFYVKYFPAYAHSVTGSDATVFLEKTKTGVANGSVFIPSLLSGYGIAGVVLTCIYIYKCLRHVKKNKTQLGLFYYMFYISWIAIFINGFQSEVAGTYYLWFLLSIPFMALPQREDGVIVEYGAKLKKAIPCDRPV